MRCFDLDGIQFELIHWASVKIKANNLVMYIDPYLLSGSPEKADIILITHDHHDHCDSASIDKIYKQGTIIVAPSSCSAKISKQVKAISLSQEMEVKGIRIKATAAYNTSKPFHPKDKKYVSYVISINNTTIYYAGDTDFIPEMSSLGNIDVAFLPIGGTYVMDTDEAIQAAKAIKPKIAVPVHYGSIGEISLSGDPEKFKKELEKQEIKVKVLQ